MEAAAPSSATAAPPPAITAEAIREAARRLDGVALKTPCLAAPRLSQLTGANIFVKYENLQPTASFKERGAYNKLTSLTEAERRGGVIAMSAGNHAQAVAYHAAQLGISAVIVMPERTPFVKVNATEGYGARVVLAGETIAESAEACAEIAAAEGRLLIHPYDDPRIVAGQGTIGFEMLEAVPELDVIVVPIGGGGLIAGIATAAKAIKPEIRIVGVEAKLFPSCYAALRGEPGRCGGSTIAEGIAVKTIGKVTLPIIAALVERVILVDEPTLEWAVNAYLTLQKTMAEGAGAAGLAALLAEPDLFRGLNVGLVLCGGNIDPRIAASIMVRELTRAGRIIAIESDYPDEPGLLARITSAVGRAGGNILEVTHNRLTLTHLARETSIRLTIETRDDAHTQRIVEAVRAAGLPVRLTEHVDGRF
ncbi:threonine ammonia-lyase [Acuticoccus sp. I52.16.1]|uniref:threonine ammonia-lyase n=1 Tax=Acuticoccus sp. I52.16.1 TaxID=2928472 RepID=UPI001FD095DB|nr:threonine ammonia-lyase [Acuticoccus sp. I52.16.1]UOM33782.1 threonine ammonia-lyase [Acuticoccus sp. I52.16.1]